MKEHHFTVKMLHVSVKSLSNRTDNHKSYFDKINAKVIITLMYTIYTLTAVKTFLDAHVGKRMYPLLSG